MPPAEDSRRQSPIVNPVESRLIIRPGAIGDTIVSLPALEHLVAPRTVIWAPEPNLPLLSHLGVCRPLVSTGIDSLELSKRTLARLEEFEEIVSWYGSARDDFRAQVAGLPFRFFQALPPEESALPAVDYYLTQVGAPLGAAPRLPVKGKPGGFAAIHPYSGSARKNWPLDRFRTVAEGLARRLPAYWCAGPEETLTEAVRFDDLGALAQWLANADVYIGNDSGVSHLAAACGVPVVAMFGPTNPEIWAPRGSNVKILPFEADPSTVIAAAESLLPGG